MAVINSKINTKSNDYENNYQSMQAVVDNLKSTLDSIAKGGGEKACQRHINRGKLLPRERVQALLDPGSPFLELSPLAAHNVYAEEVPAAAPPGMHLPQKPEVAHRNQHPIHAPAADSNSAPGPAGSVAARGRRGLLFPTITPSLISSLISLTYIMCSSHHLISSSHIISSPLLSCHVML